MLADSIGFLLAYLVLGPLICWLARRGWPEDRDEAFLASVLGPPLMALVAMAFAADVVRARARVVTGAFARRRANAGR